MFVGPTLARSEIPDCAGLELHGPAAQGDVYAVVGQRPFAIGIIDGYFERVPSVWHKEILWALSEGVHVFGAASMGALRAAELHPFGMVGVGSVFEAFLTGELEDDDEVAVTHAGEEHAFRPISDAMVNIRATLKRAWSEGIISEATCAGLLGYVKSLYYPDRHLSVLFDSPRDRGGVPEFAGRPSDLYQAGEHDALRAWLRDPNRRVDVKRADGLALLEAIQRFRDTVPGPKRVSWSFQRTDAWEQVRRGMSSRTDEPAAPERTADLVLDELRLDPQAFWAVRDKTRLRIAQARFARAEGFEPSAEHVRRSMATFLDERGLADEADIRRWMGEQSLDEAELDRLLQDQAQSEWAERLTTISLEADMLDTLKLDGSFASWSNRARAKAVAVGEGPVRAEVAADRALFEWHFARLALPVPGDLARYARSLGLSSAEELGAIIERERRYEAMRRSDAAKRAQGLDPEGAPTVER